MSAKILHILSQRPANTGSGITLESICHLAAGAGWRQQAVVGVPHVGGTPTVGPLAAADVRPVFFADATVSPGPGTPAADLAFPVPGMSDVMPYPSTVWSTMDAAQLDAYRTVWRRHLAGVIADFRPDLIHTHHIWLVSSLLRDLVPETPLVATCHATGLRQMQLCPHLQAEVVAGCRGIDRFCVLRRDHRGQLAAALSVAEDRIAVTGAGYRAEVFRRSAGADSSIRENQLLYVGKYSAAKGLPWLLDAVARLAARRPDVRLHVAGGGSGPEAELLRTRMDALAPYVIRHGQLDQESLADLMRRCAVCVLPSFYEGVPLVLVEAAACGCRLVSTALPGVVEQIQPHLGERMTLVPLPALETVDRPRAADLPVFVDRLTDALADSLDHGDRGPDPDLAAFTWEAVFGRVQTVWRDLL